MNNDLEQFSEERLKEIAQHGLNRGIYSDDLKSLARIALSAKQAKPALIFDKPDSLAYRRLIQTFEVGTEFYTTPQPSHTERDGSLTDEGTKSDGCQWNPDEESVYFTGCGHEWQFTEGGIEENGITYCPYCSGKIATPKPESE